MLAEDYTFRRSNHRLVRTIFIGTAPPAIIAQAAAYLQREPGVTLMNWNRFPIHSGLTRLRVQIDQEGSLPPFVNHWPDEISTDVDEFNLQLNPAEINAADIQLKEAMVECSTSIGVLFGARPTRLVDDYQIAKYLETGAVA